MVGKSKAFAGGLLLICLIAGGGCTKRKFESALPPTPQQPPPPSPVVPCDQNSATLTWDAWTPSSEGGRPDGYIVYWGNLSRDYTNNQTGDLTNTMQIISLDVGTYFFAVTAFNTYGESGYSSEVSLTFDRCGTQLLVDSVTGEIEDITPDMTSSTDVEEEP